MADSTRVDEKEVERRESHLRAGILQRNIIDPFSWSYPWKIVQKKWFYPGFPTVRAKRRKGAGVMFGVTLISGHLHNMWNKKPFYFAIFPRLIGLTAITALGYGLGSLREHHYKTRDAVIEHYMSLHPEDFDHFQDRSGRPFSQVLLPWYPRRAQYTKYD